MIKWLSGSRLKNATITTQTAPLTNDPLAAIPGVNGPDGKCQIYAVSRVNPLYKEEHDEEEEEEATVDENSDGPGDQRSSPRKSVSSGYESRCNSSSESSSCTECDNEVSQKSTNITKREKRLKTDKKKRSCEYDKSEDKKQIINGLTQDLIQSILLTNSTRKKRLKNRKNGSPPGSSNLSPIPEGKIDCSIPAPIWPRYEENCSFQNGKTDTYVPGRLYIHDGTTNPVNFMYKYNEKYPRSEGTKTELYGSKTEYERNWAECFRNYSNRSPFGSISNYGKNLDDSGKGSTAESTLERKADDNEFTQEVLRDLANLIAFAMSRKNSLTLGEILKTLSESIQKSLEFLSRTESDHSLRKLCEQSLHLNRISKALSGNASVQKYRINTEELAAQLKKLKQEKCHYNGEFIMYSSKDEIYSSGSEGKSSSSSGCKDMYTSSSSSSAGKDGIYSSSSFESDRPKIFHRDKAEGIYNSLRSVSNKPEEKVSDSDVSLIHHQRESSSSSVESTESAFGYSDTSPIPSDSSGDSGNVLNPVFLHENIYSVPKSVRNAIICENLNNVRNCGSSAFDKLISAKRKISSEKEEEVGPLALQDEVKITLSPATTTTTTTSKVDKTVLKKVEHPYYIAMGRPDFTLDLPQAERLMKKIASSKRRRCWCRLMTSILGLVFFLLSVMMVSLVITKGRRMFGAI